LKALEELERHELIVFSDTAAQAQRQGRPAALIRLSRRAGLVIGIEVGRRHVQVVLADLGYQVVDKAPSQADAYRHSPTADAHPEEVLDSTAKIVRNLLARNGSCLSDVVGVGLGIPAPITRSGRIGSPTLLPGWADLDPGPALASRLNDAHVLVDNDANLGALGEYGFGKDAKSNAFSEIIYVKVATGIGAGVIRGGRLARGASGLAGELGHITLDYKDPATCRCGNHGCLELYAGAEVLLKKARETFPQLRDTLDLVDRAKSGDPYCISVIQDAGDYLGVVLGTVVDLMGPDLILIGGELSDADEILLEPIRYKVRRTSLQPAFEAVTIKSASLKKWSSAWGAAALALSALG
jgi:predicted NBD/HSP70 family sugar kinase